MKNKEIEKIWNLLTYTPFIAGPWTPAKPSHDKKHFGRIFRYSYNGLPLAMASSQDEILSEDSRLESYGYLLMDKNRKIPENWFNKICF